MKLNLGYTVTLLEIPRWPPKNDENVKQAETLGKKDYRICYYYITERF